MLNIFSGHVPAGLVKIYIIKSGYLIISYFCSFPSLKVSTNFLGNKLFVKIQLRLGGGWINERKLSGDQLGSTFNVIARGGQSNRSSRRHRFRWPIRLALLTARINSASQVGWIFRHEWSRRVQWHLWRHGWSSCGSLRVDMLLRQVHGGGGIQGMN